MSLYTSEQWLRPFQQWSMHWRPLSMPWLPWCGRRCLGFLLQVHRLLGMLCRSWSRRWLPRTARWWHLSVCSWAFSRWRLWDPRCTCPWPSAFHWRRMNLSLWRTEPPEAGFWECWWSSPCVRPTASAQRSQEWSSANAGSPSSLVRFPLAFACISQPIARSCLHISFPSLLLLLENFHFHR